MPKMGISYKVSQKKHSYKIFVLEIMLFTCSQTLWSGLRSSFTKWGTAPAFTTACKTTMSASRWRAWSLVQKFYKSVFSGTPCTSPPSSPNQNGNIWILACNGSLQVRRSLLRMTVCRVNHKEEIGSFTVSGVDLSRQTRTLRAFRTPVLTSIWLS